MSAFEKYPPSTVLWAIILTALSVATHPLWGAGLAAVVVAAWKVDGNM